MKNQLMLVSALLLAGAIAAPAGPALAGDGARPDPAALQLAEDVDLGDIFLDEIERRLIRSYYSRHLHDYVYKEHGGNVPPGLAKKGGLPPGIAKKGWLPPGIYKQLVAGQRVPDGVDLYPLPNDLRDQLPRRSGYDYYIADDKVLLVRVATNLILDVLTVAAIEAFD